MRQAPPTVRDLARRLLEHEAGDPPGPRSPVDAAANACRKLHDHLAPIIGSDGFDALLTRALALARREYPALKGIHARPGGVLEKDGESSQGASHRDAEEGLALIIANVHWLLVTFIGEALASRLVGEIWPAVPPQPPELGGSGMGPPQPPDLGGSGMGPPDLGGSGMGPQASPEEGER